MFDDYDACISCFISYTVQATLEFRMGFDSAAHGTLEFWMGKIDTMYLYPIDIDFIEQQ